MADVFSGRSLKLSGSHSFMSSAFIFISRSFDGFFPYEIHSLNELRIYKRKYLKKMLFIGFELGMQFLFPNTWHLKLFNFLVLLSIVDGFVNKSII